ncbi:MAG TPA: hypothetical protein PLO53_07800 [Candidatus Hydrogenedentes bacterium]|nr:hypothetical protein [Candidatus Hydrogenedentota bacterium]
MRHHTFLSVVFTLTAGFVMAFQHEASAWLRHQVFTRPAVENLSAVTEAPAASAESLEDFLSATESELAAELSAIESWARANVPNYPALPDALAFSATGDGGTVRQRFLQAIRVNPNIKTPLYVTEYGEETPAAKILLTPEDVSVAGNYDELAFLRFRALAPGEKADALEILVSACDEPDYGLDIGLFADNQTSAGAAYGFGNQPYGNPNLLYGSQAPFHMAFFHESPIVNLAAPFLRKSLIEYRIGLYRRLASFAFRTGHDYWGWRFTGWGLHYIGDLSMPYHATALAGYSAIRMIFINLLDMIGISGPKDRAVQLASNRHLALEAFLAPLITSELDRGAPYSNPILKTLSAATAPPVYADTMPRENVARAGRAASRKVDRLITRYFPREYTRDASVEVGNLPERFSLADRVLEEQGENAVLTLCESLVDPLAAFRDTARAYVTAVRTP